MDDFETRLRRELQRVAGEARGPAPRAAQARYRQARPSMLVVSKLAVGVATIALALSASVVAAAAFSGSTPTDWGHAVKVAVERCQIEQNQPGSEIGPCVSSFIPSGLPLLPTVGGPSDTGQTAGGRGGVTSAASSPVNRARTGLNPGARPGTGPQPSPSQIPIVTPQPAAVAAVPPSPVPSAAAAAPAPTPSATPVSTPTPTPTATPTPSPSPTAAATTISGSSPTSPTPP